MEEHCGRWSFGIPYSVNSKFSFVDLDDVAEVAKIVLTEPNHKNAVYELAGTLPMSHVEIAEILSKFLKQEVKAEKIELNDWRLQASGLSNYALEKLTKMFEYYDQWGLAGNPNVLKWILIASQILSRNLLTESFRVGRQNG